MNEFVNTRKYVDMHIHSTYSDGTFNVSDILKLAEERNMAILSITDHNAVDAYDDLKDKKIRNIFKGIIVNGCEVTTTYNGEVIEILAYKIDIEMFRKKLAEITLSERDKRLRKYKVSCMTVDTLTKKGVKFRDNFGEEIFKNLRQFYSNKNETVMDAILREIKNFEENAKYFGGLDNMKKITSKEFVRKMVFNPKSDLFVNLSKIYPSLERVLEIIHECGGLAFLAHLYVYSETIAKSLDIIIRDYDFDGIEIYYTLFTEQQIEFLKNYTQKNNLYKSGGSDFHGARKQNHDLGIGKGNLRIPKEIIEEWL